MTMYDLFTGNNAVHLFYTQIYNAYISLLSYEVVFFFPEISSILPVQFLKNR